MSEQENLVTYDIMISGSEIPGDYQVRSITIEKALNRIARAKIILLDGKASSEDYEISDGDQFVPGNDIEIKGGYEGKNSTIFKGLVTGQEIRATPQGGSQLIINCRDKAVKMTIGRNNKWWKDKKDSDTISELISASGASADVTSTSVSHPTMLQNYASDWDFVVNRAEINGLVVVVSDGTVGVKDPTSASDSGLELTFGNDLFDVDLRMNAQSQLQGVTASAWDFSNQKLITGSGTEPSVPSQGNIPGATLGKVAAPSTFNLQTTAAVDSGSLTAWASGCLLKSRFARFQGSVKTQGNASLLPNTTVSLDGVGKRFSGTSYVSGIRHDLSEGQWFTSVHFGTNDHWFAEEVEVSAPEAAALIPGVSGLQNATVKQIDQDPDSQTRVLIDIPIINPAGDGVWARLSNFYATSNAGDFWMPEVGDEVVVGFFNDDPRFPVILGSLYSSQKTPPYTPDSDNTYKAFVTKNQLKIIFDDKNKVLTLITPNSNQVVLSDQDQQIQVKDQNNNEITMSSSGITMKSPSDINIEATGSVSIKGTAGVTIESSASGSFKASADLTLQGLSTTVQADTSLTCKGSASAEVNGGGMLTLKGGMCMIN